ETWTEAALDTFEQLTYCADWRPLLAKLCNYSHSDVSSWPSVKLYDNSKGKLHSGPDRGGSRLSKDTQTSLSPATSFSSSWGSPRRSQASRET
ncbi:hypothetical protein CHARACLAT_031493, partial [Characodon lateralis]|nr:hypothetical protein [Characodon lateralis]